MSKLDELPDRLTDIEAGDIIEYYDKEYIAKGVVLDNVSDPKEWRILTEDGSIPENDVELIHKRDREL